MKKIGKTFIESYNFSLELYNASFNFKKPSKDQAKLVFAKFKKFQKPFNKVWSKSKTVKKNAFKLIETTWTCFSFPLAANGKA